MSFDVNIQNLTTRMASEMKALRTLINGNAADLSGLTTVAKSNLVAAINELDAAIDSLSAGGSATNLDALTDVTLTAPATGDILQRNAGGQFVNVNPTTFLQAADSDLAAIAALATTAYGRALLTLADGAALTGLLPGATETLASVLEIATQAETNAGTDDARAITPLKLQTRLAAYAQPLDTDLTAIAALTTSTYGRALLTLADAAALRTNLGLATVATSGSASDITTGTLPTSVLPALAIIDVNTVASQAAMLALTAQKGDVAVRTDTGQTFILSTNSPTTLADWKEISAVGKVTSVNGQQGIVVLGKTDVGLGNVDNIQQQPLDATLTALAGLVTGANKLVYATGVDTFGLTDFTAFARTLLDDPDAATMRATLSVYSQAEIGSITTDYVALFNTGLL